MSATEPASSTALLERAASGHRSTLFSQGLRLVCKAAGVLVLARLVSPADHGLFAMAASVVLLLALFRDAGLGTAAMQARTLDGTQLNALFWAHLFLGGVLALITLGLAPLAAGFYATPAVTPLLALCSVAFLLIGGGGFARSQLARDARFSEVNFIESAAAIVGTVAMIAAAMLGAGAYAFAMFLLLSELIATALAWRALRWCPTGRPDFGSLRNLMRAGADLTVFQSINYVLQQIDVITVGRFFGAHALGLYSRATQLLAMPGIYIGTPLSQVALVTLSRLGRESEHFGQHARVTAMATAYLTWPLFAVCVVLPHEVVRFVLGMQWPEAAPLLQWLAISAAASMLATFNYAVSVAAGQTRRLVYGVCAILPITALAVFLGVPHGAVGVAKAIALTNVLLALPRLWWVLRDLPGEFSDYVRVLTGPFVATFAMAGGLWVGHRLIEGSWQLRLAGAGALGVTATFLAVLASRRLRGDLKIVWDYLPMPAMFRKRKPHLP